MDTSQLFFSPIPVTPYTLTYFQLPLFIPAVYLAYLARREGTYILRLSILPFVVSGLLFFGWGFFWTQENLHLRNVGQSCFAGLMVAKSIEYAFTEEGMLKIDEVRPGIKKGSGGNHRKWNQGLLSGIELLFSTRGIGFQYGVGIHVPAHKRPVHPISSFLFQTFLSCLFHFFVIDAIDSVLKLLPGIGSSSGGSIYYTQLDLPMRIVVATTIHSLTGCALISGFKLGYNFATLVAVGIFRSSPENWPPIMDDPWKSDSLHRFWAKDWHQTLRRTFFVFGGYPARQLFRLFFKSNADNSSSKNPTLEHFSVVFGTFIASGLWHDFSMYSMRRGISWHATLFFSSQSALLVGERLWRIITRRKVGGIWGRLWVYFVIFILAQPMVDSWHRRGFGGGLILPATLSPVRAVILPLMKSGLPTSVLEKLY